MTLREQFRGSTSVEVFKDGRAKEPHFIIDGAIMEDLDVGLVLSYLNGCDWTDRGSKGWITPHMRCDDFMLKRKGAVSNGQ